MDYLAQQDDKDLNPHWRRQSYILENVKLDRIIDLKELNTVIPEIESQLGLSTGIDLQSRRQANPYTAKTAGELSFVGNMSNMQLIEHQKKTNTFPAKALFYNDALRSKVKQIYKADFALYPFE